MVVVVVVVWGAPRYMDRRMLVKLNGNRSVLGVLRGFDQFMNLVLDDTVEEKTGEACGMVVRALRHTLGRHQHQHLQQYPPVYVCMCVCVCVCVCVDCHAPHHRSSEAAACP